MSFHEVIEQPDAVELVPSFAGVVQGVRGKVALFECSPAQLRDDPEGHQTFTLSLEQVETRIAQKEGSTLLRTDVKELQLPHLYEARTVLLEA